MCESHDTTAAEAVNLQRRREALEELIAHWASIEPIVIGPWTREELYERDQGM